MIETERLILREMCDGDYDALYAVLSDSDIMCHYPYTFDEARVRGWIAKNIERYRIFGFGLWAVVLKSSGEMIGDCGLTIQNINGVLKPEIGYHIRKDRQRMGYAKEAATAVRDWTFSNTPFAVLYSYMKSANKASSATARSVGMRKLDEFRDNENDITEVYVISIAEWESLKQDIKSKNMSHDYKLSLREFEDSDKELFSKWLCEEHIKRWYEHPEAWINEIEKRHDEYIWIHHFIAELDGKAIGFGQYYEYRMGGEEWHGDADTHGTYNIDYLIGDFNCIGKGFGREIISLLINRIRLHPDARLVIVQPEPDNKASCAALLSAGFYYDGQNKLYRYDVGDAI